MSLLWHSYVRALSRRIKNPWTWTWTGTNFVQLVQNQFEPGCPSSRTRTFAFCPGSFYHGQNSSRFSQDCFSGTWSRTLSKKFKKHSMSGRKVEVNGDRQRSCPAKGPRNFLAVRIPCVSVVRTHPHMYPRRSTRLHSYLDMYVHMKSCCTPWSVKQGEKLSSNDWPCSYL